jgi:hypothetical protein
MSISTFILRTIELSWVFVFYSSKVAYWSSINLVIMLIVFVLVRHLMILLDLYVLPLNICGKTKNLNMFSLINKEETKVTIKCDFATFNS